MTLQLNNRLKFGVQTIHRRTEPAKGAWLPDADEGRTMVEMIDVWGTIPFGSAIIYLSQFRS